MRVGESIEPGPGEKVTCIESGLSGGPFVFDLELGPGIKGPPVHTHDDVDEVVTVLYGEIVFRVRGKDKYLQVGDSLVLSPRDAHTFWNPSKNGIVRCRVTHSGRFERAISQDTFARMAMYLTYHDPGASRMRNPLIRLVLRLVAFVGKLRGIEPTLTGGEVG